MREVFHQSLEDVQGRLVEIAELVTVAIDKATRACSTSDVSLAEEVIEDDVLTILPPPSAPPESDSLRERIVAALASANGNVTRAAQEVGVARSGFYEALKRYSLDPASFRRR